MGRLAPSQAWASRAGLLTLPRRQVMTPPLALLQAAAYDLFARYGIAHDEVDTAAMQDLFTETGVLEVSIGGPVFDRHVGRAAIGANFAYVASTQIDQRRHAISNLVVTPEGTERARVQGYGLVSAADATDIGLNVACAYDADLICETDGLWRFVRLWIGMDFYRGAAPGTGEGA
jgi:hypothetical protein